MMCYRSLAYFQPSFNAFFCALGMIEVVDKLMIDWTRFDNNARFTISYEVWISV
jgi:hypothetical protein